MALTLTRKFKSDVVEHVLGILSDPNFIISSLPYVIGREKEKIVLGFSRLLFRFRDNYSVEVEGGSGQNYVEIRLTGERSLIVFKYRWEDDKFVIEAIYQGPRSWIVVPKLNVMALALLDKAEKNAEKVFIRDIEAVGDYSRLLSSISWTSRLIMKSMLLKNELISVPKGGLMSYVEGLISSGIIQRYPIVYVSGSGDKGSFRLLFINGKLSGIYAVIDGKEYIGNDRALNAYEGISRVRVYATRFKPEEVMNI